MKVQARRCIVVGVDVVDDPVIPNASHCVEDALDVAKFLQDIGYTLEGGSVLVSERKDDRVSKHTLHPTAENVMQAIRRAVMITAPSDLLVVYIACQSLHTESGVTNLLVEDSHVIGSYPRLLPLDEVRAAVCASHGDLRPDSRQILIVDTCPSFPEPPPAEEATDHIRGYAGVITDGASLELLLPPKHKGTFTQSLKATLVKLCTQLEHVSLLHILKEQAALYNIHTTFLSASAETHCRHVLFSSRKPALQSLWAPSRPTKLIVEADVEIMTGLPTQVKEQTRMMTSAKVLFKGEAARLRSPTFTMGLFWSGVPIAVSLTVLSADGMAHAANDLVGADTWSVHVADLPAGQLTTPVLERLESTWREECCERRRREVFRVNLEALPAWVKYMYFFITVAKGDTLLSGLDNAYVILRNNVEEFAALRISDYDTPPSDCAVLLCAFIRDSPHLVSLLHVGRTWNPTAGTPGVDFDPEKWLREVRSTAEDHARAAFVGNQDWEVGERVKGLRHGVWTSCIIKEDRGDGNYTVLWQDGALTDIPGHLLHRKAQVLSSSLSIDALTPPPLLLFPLVDFIAAEMGKLQETTPRLVETQRESRLTVAILHPGAPSFPTERLRQRRPHYRNQALRKVAQGSFAKDLVALDGKLLGTATDFKFASRGEIIDVSFAVGCNQATFNAAVQKLNRTATIGRYSMTGRHPVRQSVKMIFPTSVGTAHTLMLAWRHGEWPAAVTNCYELWTSSKNVAGLEDEAAAVARFGLGRVVGICRKHGVQRPIPLLSSGSGGFTCHGGSPCLPEPRRRCSSDTGTQRKMCPSCIRIKLGSTSPNVAYSMPIQLHAAVVYDPSCIAHEGLPRSPLFSSGGEPAVVSPEAQSIDELRSLSSVSPAAVPLHPPQASARRESRVSLMGHTFTVETPSATPLLRSVISTNFQDEPTGVPKHAMPAYQDVTIEWRCFRLVGRPAEKQPPEEPPLQSPLCSSVLSSPSVYPRNTISWLMSTGSAAVSPDTPTDSVEEPLSNFVDLGKVEGQLRVRAVLWQNEVKVLQLRLAPYTLRAGLYKVVLRVSSKDGSVCAKSEVTLCVQGARRKTQR